MANRVNLSIKGGANESRVLYARDNDNLPVNLTGATLSMRIGRPPCNPDSDWPVLTLTPTVISAAAGTFSVAFTPSATQYMAGDYWHETWVTNASAQLSVATEGRLRIQDHLTT